MPRWANIKRTPLAMVRANAGLSIEKAANAINITSRTLARYETGVSDVPMRVAEKLCVLYRVPFEIVRQAIKETWLQYTTKEAIRP